MAVDHIVDSGHLFKRVDVLRVVSQQLPMFFQRPDEPVTKARPERLVWKQLLQMQRRLTLAKAKNGCGSRLK